MNRRKQAADPLVEKKIINKFIIFGGEDRAMNRRKQAAEPFSSG